MTINDIDEKEKGGESTPVAEIKQPDTISTGELSDQELAKMFEIDIKDYGRLSPKINTLLDWAKQNTPEGEDIRWTLRRLETQLGTPPMGIDKTSFMAEYAFLWLQNKDINKKLDNYGRRKI